MVSISIFEVRLVSQSSAHSWIQIKGGLLSLGRIVICYVFLTTPALFCAKKGMYFKFHQGERKRSEMRRGWNTHGKASRSSSAVFWYSSTKRREQMGNLIITLGHGFGVVGCTLGAVHDGHIHDGHSNNSPLEGLIGFRGVSQAPSWLPGLGLVSVFVPGLSCRGAVQATPRLTFLRWESSFVGGRGHASSVCSVATRRGVGALVLKSLSLDHTCPPFPTFNPSGRGEGFGWVSSSSSFPLRSDVIHRKSRNTKGKNLQNWGLHNCMADLNTKIKKAEKRYYYENARHLWWR